MSGARPAPGSNSPWVGVLPAGGRGARLAPFRYPKELLPIVYERTNGDRGLRAKAIGEYSLEAMARAGVERCAIVVAPWKLDLVTYFGDGSQLGLSIAYVYQEGPAGLPGAIDLARPWLECANVLFAMPDTIFQPPDALQRLCAEYERSGADLALAVFPTDE